MHDEQAQGGLHLLDPVEREVLHDGTDECAHPEAVRDDGRHTQVEERRRGNRSDRSRRNAAPQGIDEHPVHTELRCGRDESIDGRSRCERHDVDLAGRHGGDETSQTALVGRAHPPVGRDGQHRGAGRPQPLELLDILVPMQLDGDAAARHTTLEGQPDRRRRALVVGDAVVVVTRRTDRPREPWAHAR